MRRWAGTLATVALCAGLLQAGAIRPAGADPNATTDDRSVAVGTKSWWYTKKTTADVTSLLSTNKARLTDIHVDPTTTPETMTVTMVRNQGAYSVATWSWAVDRTAAQVSSDVAANGGNRLISIDAYQTPSGERYAEIMVANSGPTARIWSYLLDTDPTTIQNQLTSTNSRLESVKSYLIGGVEYYSALMVNQTGIDAKNWYWALNDTVSDIQSKITAWSYRILSIEPDPAGGFDVVLVQSDGEAWWWYTGASRSQVAAHLTANHARPITVSPSLSGGTTVYTTVMMDDTNATSAAANAESKRVNRLMAKGLAPGLYGVYLKQVGVAPSIRANEVYRYEPASAIKILYLVYAMSRVQAGTDSLSSDFVYYPDPSAPGNPGVCPDPAWETSPNAVHTTLEAALTAMMQVSDNRMTRGMALRYGIGNVEAYARSTVGLTTVSLVQDRIGCLFVNGLRNQWSMTDAGALYEKIDDGSLLDTSHTATLFGFMLGGSVPSSSALANVVQTEAAKVGKSAIADQFIAGMSYREKAGNEFQCVSSNCGTTPMYLDFTSISGTITLPFKSGATVVPTDYVYARFGNDYVLPCLPGSSACPADSREVSAISTLGTWGAETYRQAIAAALATW